jgi:hypothetical protein
MVLPEFIREWNKVPKLRIPPHTVRKVLALPFSVTAVRAVVLGGVVWDRVRISVRSHFWLAHVPEDHCSETGAAFGDVDPFKWPVEFLSVLDVA